MPCARAGLPSGPANQAPDSSIQNTGADVLIRTPYSIRYAAPSRPGGEWPSSASERIERTGSISFENSAPLASAAAGISGKTEVT